MTYLTMRANVDLTVCFGAARRAKAGCQARRLRHRGVGDKGIGLDTMRRLRKHAKVVEDALVSRGIESSTVDL